jgi:hypothetical protein
LFFFIFSPLVLGSLIYLLLRPVTIKLFKIFSKNQIDLLEEVRLNVRFLNDFLPDWFIDSLPDGLWIFSFTIVFCYIFSNSNEKYRKYILFFPLIIGFILEFLQLLNNNSGTFDVVDLIFYILFYYFAIFIFNKKKQEYENIK